MRRALLASLVFALIALFILGGVINGRASSAIQQHFVFWGYPEWFPYVTALLELATAALLSVGRSRVLGAALGAAVMSAAAFTLISHGEYQHALAPVVVLGLCLIVGRIAFKRGRARCEAQRGERRSGNPWKGGGN